MDIDSPVVAVPVRSPCAIQDLPAAQRQAVMSHQVREEIELTRGQRYGLTRTTNFTSLEIHRELTEHQRSWGVIARLAVSPPQDRSHPGNQLSRREGLRHIVVSAELQSKHFVDLVVTGGEKDDRHIKLGPEHTAKVKAVQLTRKPDVDEDHPRTAPLDLGETLGGIRSAHDLEPLVSQVHAHKLSDVEIVFHYDYDLCAGSGLHLISLPREAPQCLVHAAGNDCQATPGGATARVPDLSRRFTSCSSQNSRIVPMPGYLGDIISTHRRTSAADDRDIAALNRRARDMGSTRGFARAIRDNVGLAVIAEIKRRSPSKGLIEARHAVAKVASEYAAGGAACISVLTDHDFFGGSPADLLEARRTVDLPILRKDFTVCAADVLDTRIIGADAILLIVAALDDHELTDLLELSYDVGLDVLIEVHDERELGHCLEAVNALASTTQRESTMIGVNQRDLTTFAIRDEVAELLIAKIPEDLVKVAESGVHGPEDAGRLSALGFDAVLVGEHLMTSLDRSSAVAELAAAGEHARCS